MTSLASWSSAQHKATGILFYACGGSGRQVITPLRQLLGDDAPISVRHVDTRVPDGVAASECIALHPEQLPRVPTGLVAEWVKTTALDERSYSHLVGLVSANGLSQLPALGWIAAGIELPKIIRDIDRDANVVADRAKGVSSLLLVTVSSAMGGTGAPSARLVGCAGRIAGIGPSFPGDLRWLHVVVSSSLQPQPARTQRTLALEHQQLRELNALMKPGMALRLPGQEKPVVPPGPDHVVLLASSPQSPRSLDEAVDELGSVISNILA